MDRRAGRGNARGGAGSGARGGAAGPGAAPRPPETAKAVADSIPGSEYVEAETGHFMAVQTPELFLELALPFLRG